ncbi:hypothetical protein VTI74DRAFT_5567 [Chaetomium olivicolor]
MSALKHQYPGVTLPLRHLRQAGKAGIDFYRHGSFEGVKGAQSEMLQVREVAMMILMDRLSDKPNWHEKVFNDDIVAKWREEALTQNEEALYLEILGEKDPKHTPLPQRVRIMNEACFDYCIAELKCKSAYFKQTGMVFTANAGSNSAVKSDSLVSEELHQGLKAAFEKLLTDQADDPDWHPWTDDKVQDLVHPSMYPFVYGEINFIPDEVVGLADAVDKWSGKGEVVPKDESSTEEIPYGVQNDDHGDAIDRTYWSTTYQWLPANLAFQEDGTVRFTSYINNLHPKKYPEIYTLVEKLIDTAIPVWDRVLSGRAVNENGEDQKRFGPPPPVDDDNRDDVWEPFNENLLAMHEAEHGPIPYDNDDIYLDEYEEEGMTPEQLKVIELQLIAKQKWKEIRDPILPDPEPFEPVSYKLEQTLREKFKDSGLQVIVKMASIELTPEKPDFPPGGWHIEGQMNEHIVATALFYVDSENVTPSSLSFRMATSSEQWELQDQVGQDCYDVYERIFGTVLSISDDGYTVQTYGSVETKEGRLLAFPNVFQHRVSPFSLRDRTKPGHRRFIALWLVDPHQRIISTANVPPQQFDWWAEAVFGSENKAATGDIPPELFQLLLEQGAAKAVKPTEEMLKKMGNRLPVEVMEMVRRQRVVPEGLMTAEVAKAHRLKLMEERSAFVKKNENEWHASYSFCEH